MKQINESRIADTATYVKAYYREHGICPSYREIKEEFNYSSLSIVKADIDRLKERGVLVEDDIGRLRLAEEMKEKDNRYKYPFLIFTSAGYHPERLNDEDKKLLEAQDSYLKGDYKKAQKISKELLNVSEDNDILFGAKLTLCWSAIYTGDVQYWKDYFRMMLSYQSKNVSEKMEKELMAHFLSSTLGSKENCPSWLEEGRFNELRKEAYPLASLLFVSKAINAQPPVLPRYLEPFCAITSLHQIDIAEVYMNLYLAIAYRYSDNEDYLMEHLTKAVNTCLKHNWLTPLAEVRRSLGSVMYPLLDRLQPRITEKIDAQTEQLVTGYNKLYETIVGENVTGDLTFREVEVINYVHMGYSNKEIAKSLYLSPETVKYYLSSIYLKLNVSGRKELKTLIKKYI